MSPGRLCVARGGLLTQVQDLGRWGYQRYGVPVGGVMDEVSHRLANLLVGNPAGEATLEMLLAGPAMSFDVDCLVALCGARFAAAVDGRPLPPDRPVLVRAGAVLDFGAAVAGARAYLAVAGGFDLAPVLGSLSTFALGALGGFRGRALKRGDEILLRGEVQGPRPALQAVLAGNGAPFAAPRWALRPLLDPAAGLPARVRFIPGLHWEAFSEAARAAFTLGRFRLGSRSDAMGYRLEGVAVAPPPMPELASAGVTYGTVQVPPDGEPIVLMASRHTTGGYPRLGEVIAVDLPVLAQLIPGGTIGFAAVSLDQALDLLRHRQAALSALEQAVSNKEPR